jgi:hypothetical protein
MKLEQWVLFIDMLGYREINGQIIDDEKGNAFLDFMKSNEKIFSQQDGDKIKQEYQSQPFDLYKYYEIQTTFISDSLIINYKPIEIEEKLEERIRMMHSANTLFVIINRLQAYIYNCLKEHNILVRGGISNKYCLIRDNYAVGEGVIDAYINESKRAIYPRIVLSKNITDNKNFIDSFNFISNQIYNKDTFLKEDGDNIYYLDYLKYNIQTVYISMLGNVNAIKTINIYLTTHKETIIKKIKEIDKNIDEEKNPEKLENLKKIKEKIIWLKNYHNESIKELIPQFKIEY